MANNFNIAGLIVLDTVTAGDILAASAPVKIQSIYWDCGAAGVTGDRVVLTDTAGNSIFEATILTSVASAPAMVDLVKPITVKGLKLPTLAHGKLFIFTA